MSYGRKYVGFDLEIVKIMENGSDWESQRPLGISCAATLTSDTDDMRLWYGDGDAMTVKEAAYLVRYLEGQVARGYYVLSWNGLGFDYDILAEESGERELCARIAWEHHVDMMFHFFCIKGFPVGLDKVAKGMGLSGKTEGMSGALAPVMWAAGERDKVLEYVAQDARTTLEVALAVEKAKYLAWITRRGTTSGVAIPYGWLPVNEAVKLPLPDTSWMDDPWPREKFTGWLGEPQDR